jgi:hypothetical protein
MASEHAQTAWSLVVVRTIPNLSQQHLLTFIENKH